MHLSQKMIALDRVYDTYAQICADFEVACQKRCAHCCTNHVTATTLEGYRIVHSATPAQRTEMEQWLQTASCRTRFKPGLTINQIARLCVDGKDIPEDNPNGMRCKCPLLSQDLCRIYSARPFGCRCMMSREICRPDGYAKMDPFVLTVNNVFLQLIEHIDATGCSGSLVDVLRCLLNDRQRNTYETRHLNCRSHQLIPNRTLKVLMVPPAHQKRIQPILAALRQITV